MSVSKVAVASLTSQGTMGGLIVGGLLLKSVGWRVIIVTGAVYGAVYAYERLTWTSQVVHSISAVQLIELSFNVSTMLQAKCREFKRQYVDHAARKLRLIVDMTSANCSHQVRNFTPAFSNLAEMLNFPISLNLK